MKYTLALALILGTVGNQVGLDDPECCACDADADTDDDIIREDFNGHTTDLDRLVKKALMRLRVRPTTRTRMSTPLQSEMLRLFQTGATQYQPDGLAAETGDPKIALDNLHRLLGNGRMILTAFTRPSGTLFLFSNGEQYYTPALRLSQEGRQTEGLAEIAAEAGYGDLEDLLDFYTTFPAGYEGQLPNLHDADQDQTDLQAAPEPSGKRAAKKC